MNQPLRLILAIHNHQPIGNFDGVFEQAYQDSYRPFLEVFERFKKLRIALHTSGSLMEWLDANHPEYVDRLAGLVASGRIEILGGPFYEPILTMIPSRDRVGQIASYTQWLEDRLGATIRGMWVPERVWEQGLTSDLVRAGIEYTILDDYHFKNAGLTDAQLAGYYVTEDDANVLKVLPGSERLRYLVPFQSPKATIDYLYELAQRHPGGVIVFGDDGEKFGTWPGTKSYVYDQGWLAQFFEVLEASSEWLRVTTPAEAVENVPPQGKVYVPEGSYREMTEWSMPSAKINQFENVQHQLQEKGLWESTAEFIRGGFWRNYKVKYPETDYMYARMQMVSRRLHEMSQQVLSQADDSNQRDLSLLDEARQELYRGQCNCSYWHGAFGGVYLPHLRNAIYQHLIAADNLLDQYARRGWQSGEESWVELEADDYNLDGRKEVKLTNNRLLVLVSPIIGGQIYELDVKSICHNLLATLARRPEAYHRKVLEGPAKDGADVASIHDQVIFKQEGLDERLDYDAWSRHCLVDHFVPQESTLEQIAAGRASELGDFVHGSYEAKLRRSDDRVQLQLSRQGLVADRPLRLTKGITLSASAKGAANITLEIAYLLEDIPTDITLHFSPELNFAGLPGGAKDRYFQDASGQSLGHLGNQLDLQETSELCLLDEWLGIEVGIQLDQPSGIWSYPVETVSQSEGGFELVHQSVVVQPHWTVVPDARGRWSVTMQLVIDTQQAEARMGLSTSVAIV
ncbi:MAG: alpha-amylase/4-alpha-glucanotransferase domain-containing protein [Pirellulales bacterium]